ncbi:MAG: tetratricopeptide (TPR) repeat protein [Flavobacteriales bacterium]
MILKTLIETLSQEETQSFKAYLRRRNKRSDTKNTELLALLQKEILLKNIDVVLYGKPSRNAYHALCKRLHDNLIDFIASRSFETESSEELQVFKFLLSARIFYENKQHIAGLKTLARAEIKAQQIDLYSALSEIYHTQIQYAHHHPDIHLDSLIERFRHNQKLHTQQENLNLAYASLQHTLLNNPPENKKNINQLLEQTFKNFEIDLNESLSFKSLYQLLEIINTLAHRVHDFSTILPLISSIEQKISARSDAPHKHLYYRIHSLYFIANAYFRNRQFKMAHTYLSQMETAMEADRGRFKVRFRENALLLQTLALNYTGKATAAIEHIETYMQMPKTKATPDLILALTVFYVQQEDFKSALQQLNQLKHSDTWYLEKEGRDWLIKRDLVALIIHLELEHLDLTDSLLRRFRRTHASEIASDTRLSLFLSYVRQIHNSPQAVEELRFRESVQKHFTTEQLHDEDIFLLSFFSWIKAKINKASIYTTTLDLIAFDQQKN